MTREEFRLLTEEGPVLLDGGTGSCLRSMGMPAGVCTEQWVYEHPEVIGRLQREYADAGSRILYAPTFGANRISLGNMGLSEQTEEYNRTLAGRTLENVGDRVLVAGDLSTTGQPMEPYGPMTYGGLMEIYKEQIRCLAEAGVELLGAETLLSLDEALVICDAAREVCDLPLMISFSCEGDGKLYFGGTVAEGQAITKETGQILYGCLCKLKAYEDCGMGPDQLEAVIRQLKETVSIPVLAKPNAGMPVITQTGEAVYSMGAEDFAEHVLKLRACGASVIGGCCGTTPEYIRRIKALL